MYWGRKMLRSPPIARRSHLSRTTARPILSWPCCCKKKGHASDAAAHYNAASLHRPNWPEPHLYRGALHEARSEFEDAPQAYGRAISLGAPEGFALRRDLQVPIIPVSKTSYAEARTSYLHALDAQLADPPAIGNPIREAGGNRFFLAYHGLDDRPFLEKQARLMRTGCPSLSWTAPHCRSPRPDESASRHASCTIIPLAD